MAAGDPAADRGLHDLRPWLRGIPDFPRPGILFQDVSPLLQDARAFAACLDAFAARAAALDLTHVAAIESRGFLFGAPLADRLGLGFLPVRKPGKLPWKTYAEAYELEYGQGTLEIHVDAAAAGERVLLVDDLLATGGTAAAAVRLVRRTGAEVLAAGFAVELAALDGRRHLHGIEVFSLTTFED